MSDFIGLFNRGVFDDEDVKARIRGQLARGRAIVIPDALRAEVAERVHADLDASTRWKLYERSMPYFHYRHHNLYSHEELPASALEVKRAFESDDAKSLMSELSQRDCGGPLDFGASLYRPGDHSLPHQDFGLGRNVAFVWHLTRRWEPTWGGGLFWCPSGITVLPQFNCLTLFVVSRASAHFVTVVSPEAREKRLSINGWWIGAEADRERFEPSEADDELPLSAAGYGSPVERMARAGGGAKIVAM